MYIYHVYLFCWRTTSKQYACWLSLINTFKPNAPNRVEIFSTGLKRLHLVGNIPTRESIVTLQNLIYLYDSVCCSGWKRFQPGEIGFYPGVKVSNQVETFQTRLKVSTRVGRFQTRWKGFKPGEQVSTRVERVPTRV